MSMTQKSLPMPWPEVVIFDCDGVLVDSELIALGQTRRALDDVGLKLTDAETHDQFLGRRLDSIVQHAEAALGAALPPGFSSALSRDILARFERELRGIEGVRQAIAGLRARICVASSSSLERIRRSLALAGYDALFEPNIFSATMVARGKPSPDLFIHAAAQMKVAPAQCLVIEDSVAGVVGAAAAGMKVFGFAGGSHFSDPSQIRRLSTAGAALVFDDMSQLPDIIAAQTSKAG